MKRVRKNILLLILGLFSTFAQVRREGLPLSKKLVKQGKYLRPVPKYTLPYMNSDSLRAVAEKLLFGKLKLIKL